MCRITFPVTGQEYFIVCYTCREVKKLFRFLLSSCSMIVPATMCRITFPVTGKEYFIVCYTCREVKKLFRFLTSPVQPGKDLQQYAELQFSFCSSATTVGLQEIRNSRLGSNSLHDTAQSYKKHILFITYITRHSKNGKRDSINLTVPIT
jgi:hypothetical protein